MNEKVLRYWLSASPELILWGVLLFTFKYDYWREDFAFIPMQSTWVMAILFTIRLKKIITNTITKWTKDGTR